MSGSSLSIKCRYAGLGCEPIETATQHRDTPRSRAGRYAGLGCEPIETSFISSCAASTFFCRYAGLGCEPIETRIHHPN